MKYGFNNPDNPGCPTYTDGLTRKGILSSAGVKLFDPDALCDTRVTWTPQGYFGAPAAAVAKRSSTAIIR